jgi:hypothetical protein
LIRRFASNPCLFQGPRIFTKALQYWTQQRASGCVFFPEAPALARKLTHQTPMKILITAITAATFAVAMASAQDKPPGPPPGGGAGGGGQNGGPGGPGGGPGGPGGKKPNPEDAFKHLDSNGDGSVSLDEFKAGPRAPKEGDKAQEIFGKIDKDGNGSVSLEEFKAHRPPHGPGGPGGKGSGGGGGQTGPGGAGPGGPGGGHPPKGPKK